jgi:hypothetical protein
LLREIHPFGAAVALDLTLVRVPLNAPDAAVPVQLARERLQFRTDFAEQPCTITPDANAQVRLRSA